MDQNRRLFRKVGEHGQWEVVPKSQGINPEDLVGINTDKGTPNEADILKMFHLACNRPGDPPVQFDFRDAPRHLFMRHRKVGEPDWKWSPWKDTGDPSELFVLSGYDTRVGKEQDLILVLKGRHEGSGYEVEYEFREI